LLSAGHASQQILKPHPAASEALLGQVKAANAVEPAEGDTCANVPEML